MSRFTRRAVSVIMAAAMRVMSPAAPSAASSAPAVEPEQIDATGRDRWSPLEPSQPALSRITKARARS
jgi:hypothetical protein